MPELPEVENLRRGLEKAIIGQKILQVKVFKPKLVSSKGNIRVASGKKAREFESGLKSKKFIAIERRAKNLVFKLSDDKIILAHLKMSGQFVYLSTEAKALASKPSHRKSVIDGSAHNAYSTAVAGGHPIELSGKEIPNKHTHIIFKLSNGNLYYNDIRKFGYLLYYPSALAFEKENHFALLGLEPFDRKFTLQYFIEALKTKKGEIKAVLMDQKIVTGLGNIYADESLFEAEIHPERSAAKLAKSEIKRLHAAILRITRQAIKLGGSSVATYRLLDKSRGNYAREHKVYGKAGQKCSRCDSNLKKTIVKSRTTIFCPDCQK